MNRHGIDHKIVAIGIPITNIAAGPPDKLGAPALQVFQVIGIVDHAEAVGILVIDFVCDAMFHIPVAGQFRRLILSEYTIAWPTHFSSTPRQMTTFMGGV